MTGSSRPRDRREAVGELSDLDRAIIRILQADGRCSAAEIARRTGATERVVRRRLSDLTGTGVITVTTVADPAMLGYRSVALLALTTDGSRPASDVAADLARLDAVDYAVVVTGRYDVLVEVVCRDPVELLRISEREVLAVLGVHGCETFPYLQLRYQEPVWERARSKGAPGGVKTETISLDEIDRALIHELSSDGRAPYRDLCSRLGISQSQARARVARLTDSGAVRVMAITKPESLGYGALAWLAITVAAGASVQRLADRLAGLEAIAYLAATVGAYDIFAEAICIDLPDLDRLLDQEVRQLDGLLRVEAMVCLDQHYHRIRPLI